MKVLKVMLDDGTILVYELVHTAGLVVSAVELATMSADDIRRYGDCPPITELFA